MTAWRVIVGGIVMVAIAFAGVVLSPAEAKGGRGYTSIYTEGQLVNAGWAKCPTAITWDADVSALSKRAGRFALEDLEWALSVWGKAAGLTVARGSVVPLTYDNTTALVTGGGAGRRIFVKFVPDAESDYLSGRVVGVASPTRVIPALPEIIGGSAAFRVDYVEYASKSEQRTLILHELGHALGLGHSDDRASVMYPIVTNTVKLSTGDRTGIRAISKDCDPTLQAQRG